MIVDYAQTRDTVETSYVNSKGLIELESIVPPYGHYVYTECHKGDPKTVPDIVSFRGSHMRRYPKDRFTGHNQNEFICRDILKLPEVTKLVEPCITPKPFSVDIETDITDDKGYSTPELAENRILSISFTDENLKSVLFLLKNPDHPTIDDMDNTRIRTMVNAALGENLTAQYSFPINIRIFDTETEMLNVFLECMNKYFHLIIGWNFLGYDWQYIFNRCFNLGINPKKASPTFRLTKKTIPINKDEKLTLMIPSHRIVEDYMQLFKDSMIYSNWGNYSLDYAASEILNVGKISYSGNLRKLYREDFLKFVAYAFVDTILVMLLHKKTNLINVNFFQSYYTKVPVQKITQTSISEALVYHDLRAANRFLLESEYTGNKYRPYQGGFVKDPTKKFVESLTGVDYRALYPNSIIANGLSPEGRVAQIAVDHNCYPLTEKDREIWEQFKKQGCCLVPSGNIYDVSKDTLYVRIEKELQRQRTVFRKHEEDIYLNIEPKIAAEMKRRGLVT